MNGVVRFRRAAKRKQADGEATPLDVWSGKPAPEVRHPVLLAVATGAYRARWQFCIDSQRAYARRNRIAYVLRTQERPPHNGKWTKIVHAAFALAADRDVMMIDADAEITRRAPHFGVLLDAHPDRDIFYANGISGRPNSGVMLFRGGRDSTALALLRLCLDKSSSPVPQEDFVTEDGENGHFIHFLKRPEFAERALEIDRAWNDSLPAGFDRAYVRHYTNKLRASLWHGDILGRLSQPLAVRSDEEFRIRAMAIAHQAGRPALLTDLQTDPERLARFQQTVGGLYRLRRLSPPLPERDDAQAWLVRHEFATGLLDAATCEVVTRIVRPGMTIIDIGAAPGHVVRAALRAAASKGRFIAIESDGSAIDALRRNVGRVPRTLEAVLSGPGARTIDDICRRSKIKAVALIRIDADGREAEVLQSAAGTIRARGDLVLVVRIDAPTTRALGLDPAHVMEVAFDLGLVGRRINPDFSLAPAGLCDPDGAHDYLFASAARWRTLKRALFFRRAAVPGRPRVRGS